MTLETVWAMCWILFHLTDVSLMVQGEAIPPHDTMDQHPIDTAKHEAVEIQVFSIKGKLWFISHHFNSSNRATCKRGQLFMLCYYLCNDGLLVTIYTQFHFYCKLKW